MAARDRSALFHGLNADQREAVEAVSGPVCVLAGAGTGKTTTITRRIANQVATRAAEPGQIMAVTFTDKAAGELRRRLQGLGITGAIRAATFHAAAWAQLRYFWTRISDRPLPQVAPSKVPLLIGAARRLRVEARDLATEIEWAKSRDLDPAAYEAQARDRQGPLRPAQMAMVYDAYERAKDERGLIDYEDMLLQAGRAIRNDAEIAETFRDRYRFFTVDEFQDVNPAQWALLRAWLGDSRELCVVGDDDQTIYTFTGASSDYLLQFRVHYPDARTITLSDNYRSTGEILAVANRILRDKPGEVRKTLRARCDGGPPPRFEGFEHEFAERKALVRAIRRLLDRGVTPAQIAVCYRVNSQSEPLEEALEQAGIPFLVRGEGGFFDRPEIRQAMLVLRRAVAAPADPTGVPPPQDAQRAHAPAADRLVADVLREQLAWHPRREPSGDAARERWRNLGALAALAERLVAADPAITLERVVAELAERAAAGDAGPSEAGAVTLLTLHKAKGLEFEAVFLVACEEGLLPISHARTDAAVAEERRLFYVGVTRARRHLWVSWAMRRAGWSGRVQTRRPSRFLDGLVPGSGGAAGAAAAPAADPAVFELLRQWRLRRSREEGVPAFVVCSDRTLAELAAASPRAARDLLRIHGLGPAKVGRYGNELLGLLADTARTGP